MQFIISRPHLLIKLFLLLRERHEAVVQPAADIVGFVV